MRKLTKQTIKPVISFLGGWHTSLYSLNTKGADFYHFTLDTYKGENSFTGGFAWGLDGCYDFNGKPYDRYAVDMKNKQVYDLVDKKIVMTVQGGLE